MAEATLEQPEVTQSQVQPEQQAQPQQETKKPGPFARLTALFSRKTAPAAPTEFAPPENQQPPAEFVINPGVAGTVLGHEVRGARGSMTTEGDKKTPPHEMQQSSPATRFMEKTGSSLPTDDPRPLQPKETGNPRPPLYKDSKPQDTNSVE